MTEFPRLRLTLSQLCARIEKEQPEIIYLSYEEKADLLSDPEILNLPLPDLERLRVMGRPVLLKPSV